MFSQLDPKHSPLSSYQPSHGVISITKEFKDAFGQGVSIINREWEELNNYSVVDRMNRDRRTFNSYVDESVEDPMEAWKWKGTRSIARNRAMAMHAHMTATLAIPMAFAQNDKQEEDRTMSNIMRDILEWMAVNSEYRENYVACMMGTLVDPVVWLGADYVESYTTVKDQNEDGSYTSRDVLDEELSGFRTPVHTADQVLITNAYEQNAQRQHIVIRRQYKSYTDVKRRWEWHSNFVYVSPGIKTVYSDEEGLFYDIKDDEHPNLVEEATGWCRYTDTEVTWLNGIYMGNEDVEHNAIRHRDNYNVPKVPLVPFGYERIGEHFFYWKSLMNRVGWDSALIDAMYENTMNRESIDLYTPMAMYGVEEFSTSVVFPGAVVAFENPDAKAEPLIPPNRSAGYQALREIEKSVEESSISDVQTGSLPEKEQKAFNVARAEHNARTVLRGSLRSISFSVMKYGDLMKDIALQHFTTAQMDEITGAEHYRTFVLRDQTVNGKQVSKNIIFDDGLIGRRMTEAQEKREALKMLTQAGYPKNKEHIYRVNPHIFSKLKYLVRIEPDEMIERNSAFERAVSERMYALLRQDPLVSGESLVRKLLNANYRGEAEDMMAEPTQDLTAGAPEEHLKNPKRAFQTDMALKDTEQAM